MTAPEPRPRPPGAADPPATDDVLAHEPARTAPGGLRPHEIEPGALPATAEPVARGPQVQHLWAVLSEVKRRGDWSVPEHLMVTAVAGESRLDLRQARFTAEVTTVEVKGLLGEVRVIVPDTCRVECSGSAFLGEFDEKEADPVRPAPDGAPLVRVVGASVLSEVRVYRTGAPVGEGRFAVDGMRGTRHRLRRLRARRSR